MKFNSHKNHMRSGTLSSIMPNPQVKKIYPKWSNEGELLLVCQSEEAGKSCPPKVNITYTHVIVEQTFQKE